MPAGTFILHKLSMPFEVIPDAHKRTKTLMVVAHNTKHALTNLLMSATRPKPSCNLATISKEDAAETARAHTHLNSFMRKLSYAKGSYFTYPWYTWQCNACTLTARASTMSLRAGSLSGLGGVIDPPTISGALARGSRHVAQGRA
eukprot:6211825-Pleurochrysis_carterae.AAC.1